MPRRLPLALLSLTVWLTGCPGTIEDPDRFRGAAAATCPSDFDVERDLFARTCGTLGCHTGGPELAAAGLDLSTVGIGPRLMSHRSAECGDRLLVDPRDPMGSLLLDKVGDDPACGERMPAGLPPLNATERTCLESYLLSLAGAAPSVDGSVEGPDAGVPTPDAGGEPPRPTALSYEAEAMELVGFVVDDANPGFVRLPDGTATGSAALTFDGPAGAYSATVHVAAESDGQPSLRILVNDSLVYSATYPLGAAGIEPLALPAYELVLAPGDRVVLEGDSEAAAWARLDRLELTP